MQILTFVKILVLSYNYYGGIMAKRKKSKETKNKTISVELTGLILVLISIIGFGFGYVGNLIKMFAMFLFGTYYIVLVLFVFFVGLYMLFKRKIPKFFNNRLVGFYVMMIVVLTSAHFGFLEGINSIKEITGNFFDSYLDAMNTIKLSTSVTEFSTPSIGGGIIGSISLTILYFLFAKTGAIIVLIVLGIFGFIMFFDITLADMFDKVKGLIKFAPREKGENVEYNVTEVPVEDVAVKEVHDDKVIITSIDEIKNKQVREESLEEKKIEPEIETDTSNYHLPKFDILNEIKKEKKVNSNEYTLNNKNILERVLNDFDIKAKVVEIHVGPAVTQYELTVPSGTKVSRISSINKEIALALAAKDVRIQAPIPGKNTIGIELANQVIASVPIREILESTANIKTKDNIIVALGKDLMGNAIVADIAKMPHLLVAGSTGSGKSVCVNSMICSILMRYKPSDVKLVLVDPKKVELSNYNGTPHLLCPVVTDPKKASITLQKIVSEMEKRYEQFSEKGVKKISEYNALIDKDNKRHPEALEGRMPYIVVIIDELADLMLVASKEVEDSIMRITQMARAAGIHLVVATQRPSTDVITGVVKANIPSRISFAVASSIDSRTILDASGAEKLLGKGDMLYLPMGENTPERIQGCFISDDEINRLINYCARQLSVKYDEELSNPSSSSNSSSGSGHGGDDYDDPMYNEVVEFAIMTGKISASLIQRKFRFGYNRAARMMDLLEDRGIVGPQNGSKPREVLVKLENQDGNE